MKSPKTIHTEEYRNLINFLTDERKRLGLSQVEVASKLNMVQSDISKIESLERRVDVLELKALLNIYRIKKNEKLSKRIIDFFGLSES